MSRQVMRWPTRALLLLTLLILPACASQTGLAAIKCQSALAKPISYDRLKDTVDTILAIKRHNAAWIAECNASKP